MWSGFFSNNYFQGTSKVYSLQMSFLPNKVSLPTNIATDSGAMHLFQLHARQNFAQEIKP